MEKLFHNVPVLRSFKYDIMQKPQNKILQKLVTQNKHLIHSKHKYTHKPHEQSQVANDKLEKYFQLTSWIKSRSPYYIKISWKWMRKKKQQQQQSNR